MYRIRDLQFDIRYFGGDNGIIFETKQDILEQLIHYHDIDFTGSDDKDNELSIEEYFKFWKIRGGKAQLKYILEYGQWEIEEVKSDCCDAKLINHGFDIVETLRNFHFECKKCHKLQEILI